MKHFSILLFLATAVYGQDLGPCDDIDIDDPDPIPPTASALSLEGAIYSGINYYAHIPKGLGDVTISNLGREDATLLMVGITERGRQSRTFQFKASESKQIPADLFDFAEEIFLFSLQDFSVKARSRSVQAGKSIEVHPAKEPMRLLEVHTPDGDKKIVGVDKDNAVYYPIYSNKQPIGYWSERERTLTLEDGTVLADTY